MRDVDDPRFVKLLRQYPGFPVEFVQHLYRLDRTIDEMKYRVQEIGWEKAETDKRRAQIIERAIKEIEKINPPEKK